MQPPLLRSDLEISKRRTAGESYRYLIHDKVSGEVFEFGEEEFFLCKELDGKSPLPDIQERFEKRFNARLNIEQLEALVSQLREDGLLEGYQAGSYQISELFQSPPPETWKRWKLLNPEKPLNWIAEKLSWCFTRPFLIASFFISLLAVGVLMNNFSEFLRDVKLLFKPLTLFQVFAVMYVFVNLPAEIARGVTSSRFGGYTGEFGIWLAYNTIPRFYCLSNVTVIGEKAKRGWILFSPSFYSILMGSSAIIMWRMTVPGTSLHNMSLIIAVVSVFDAFIRLNFLWPTEASYLLSNWFDKQDFRKRAIRTFKSWIFRRPMPEPLSTREKQLFIWYGLLTAIATFLALIILAYFVGKMLISYLAGTGALIFSTIVFIKYGKGFFAIMKENIFLQRLSDIHLNIKSKKKARLLFWSISLLIILLFPYPYEVGGPFKILSFEKIELHTQVSGEIKKVLVKENDLVKKGDLQAVIDVREHQKNFDATQADLDRAEHDVESARTRFEYSSKEKKRLRALFKEGVIAEEEYDNAAKQADVDEKDLKSAQAVGRDLRAKLKFYKENVEHTNLLAPISGRVITPYVDTKVGQMLNQGDLFAVYEDMEMVQAEIQVPEEYIDDVKMGAQVKVRPQAYPTRFFRGDVVLIAPSATDTPNGKVIRVLTLIDNSDMELRPEMTGEAKIEGGWKPVIVAFTKAIVRFFMVEVWSWFP
jgi:putative peptide zinc metalloprotease protein